MMQAGCNPKAPTLGHKYGGKKNIDENSLVIHGRTMQNRIQKDAGGKFNEKEEQVPKHSTWVVLKKNGTAQ